MQRVENIESSDLCQHCNSLKRSALTQRCILLEAGQCSHCSCLAIHSLLPLLKSRSIAFRLSSSSSHQSLGWGLQNKGHSQAKAFFRPRVYDALTLLDQTQGSQWTSLVREELLLDQLRIISQLSGGFSLFLKGLLKSFMYPCPSLLLGCWKRRNASMADVVANTALRIHGNEHLSLDNRTGWLVSRNGSSSEFWSEYGTSASFPSRDGGLIGSYWWCFDKGILCYALELLQTINERNLQMARELGSSGGPTPRVGKRRCTLVLAREPQKPKCLFLELIWDRYSGASAQNQLNAGCRYLWWRGHLMCEPSGL